MKNNILFISSKKLSAGFEELENDFSIQRERDIIKAFKSVFVTVPDVVIINADESVFGAFHFIKLMKKLPQTAVIPVILAAKTALPDLLTGLCAGKISTNSNYQQIVTIIDNTLKDNILTKKDKDAVKNTKLSTARLKLYTAEILDEILITSSVSEEFKPLLGSMNFEKVLCENIIKIISKYVSYDAIGLFFNNSDELKRNVLNLSFPNKNIPMKTVDTIRDKFFDEIEKYKSLNEIQCNLIDGDIAEKGKLKYESFKKVIILPYKHQDDLYGGIIVACKKEPDIYQNIFLNVIAKELEVIFKIKYIFTEQENHAVYDRLTGLFNKQEFEANLDKEFHRARRYIFNFTLAMLDIDNFSKLNEKYGRDFGDFILKELSRLLKEVFRRTDLIYRYGGEEMIILLPSTPITKSVIPIERLRDKISHHTFEKDGIKTNITVSVGLCANYSKFTAPEQLLDAVGTSLLRAKEGGRNKVDIFE